MGESKQQIYVAADPGEFPAKGFEMACRLAETYSKDICLLGIMGRKETNSDVYKQTFEEWIKQNKDKTKSEISTLILEPDDDLTSALEDREAAMLVFEIQENKPYNKVKNMLEMCRQLRIPYFFVRKNQSINFSRIIVPVGFLQEEREKGPFSSSFGRFFKSEIMLMTAKDYGSRAKNNTDAIQTLLDKSQTKYSFIEAKKDSFKVEMEAVNRQSEIKADIIMISASRDYSIDDILFGTKEQKIIEKSTIPVMVINPRKDLYALCG